MRLIPTQEQGTDMDRLPFVFQQTPRGECQFHDPSDLISLFFSAWSQLERNCNTTTPSSIPQTDQAGWPPTQPC